MSDSALDTLSINTIRTLAIDAVQKANSGHPGLPMGAAPMAYALWNDFRVHDPKDPTWINRDRFILSAGHGSMLLYALLHLTGYDVSLDDLKNFRQWDSPTAGHPEWGHCPGVDATTGPLGQGSANAVGMAIAERLLAKQFNRPGHEIVDHMTYALVSDGDLMEGIAAEAGSLAGHLGLGKLVYVYDDNDICLDGPTSNTFTEDVAARYESYGWHVQRVENGDTDLAGLRAAIAAAKAETGKPSLVLVKTTIGYGSPNKAGKAAAHGSPLGPDEVAAAKEQLGWDVSKHFYVPDEVAAHLGAAVEKGGRARAEWQERFEAYRAAHSDLAAAFEARVRGELPAGWDSELPTFAAGDSIATRSAASKAENAIAAKVPGLAGGDADLSCSTKSAIAGEPLFARGEAARNIQFGVREHAMGAIVNGMDYHGALRAFASTFFVFSDYMRGSVRLSALNKQPVIYVWTHDSIGVGEDGPTHQPVEHLASLRAMPNLHVMRPCDGNEATEAWRYAMARTDGPTALVLSRQNLPVLDRETHGAAAGLARGAYVLADADGATPDAILIGTGAEVHVALAARELLAADGIKARVVSMPCWEAFSAQPDDYREEVLPRAVRARVSVEAGATFGWERWTGDAGTTVGIDRFGASAPGGVLFEKFGFTAEAVKAAALASIDRAGK